MPADPARDLRLLLAEERRLIRKGAWAELGPLAGRKEACLAALRTRPARLAPLAPDLARNQALLVAALDGLRDLGRRRAAARNLVTYDAQGARAELPLRTPRVERRA